MSGVELDFSELTEFEQRTLHNVITGFPGEAKRFMRKAGNAYRKNLRAAYRRGTKKKTGNLLKGVRRGRVYIYNGDEYQVRAYNKAPHASLIEHGHVLWRHLPQEKKAVKTSRRVKGRHIAGTTEREFETEFTKMAKEFVDETLERGFG